MTFDPHEASIAELNVALSTGETTSTDLVEAYERRISAEDDAFNSVAFLNSEAGDIAKQRDAERAAGQVRGPLHGVPVMVKDNLDTGDTMPTTAGSLALDGSMAARDSHVVARLRDAGAVLLAKTNLSEWANFRSTRSASGWSSRGGQVRNAYATDRTPGGSSSGSGVAVARSYCAAAIGTETDGSIVGPSSFNGIVGIKPTVGLVGRTGIIPISASQDTAGPMARTVADAAVLLGAIAGTDPDDTATSEADRHKAVDYTAFLDTAALKGARVGVVRNYAGYHEVVDAVFEGALAAIREAGAEVVDGVSLTPQPDIRRHELLVMLTEFKAGLNAYLDNLGPDAAVHSLAELIAFNAANADRAMPHFRQELLERAEATPGLSDRAYIDALAESRRLTRSDGIDKAMGEHRLDVLVAPTNGPPWAIDWINGDNRLGGSACQAAVSGYAGITVPMGHIAGLPLGLNFIAGPWSEAKLIGYAHAFEQATNARVAPGEPRRLLP